MNVADLCFSASGLVINLPRSKADQEQAGDKVAIPFGEHEETCRIKAFRQWLTAAEVTDGAVFRGVDRRRLEAPPGVILRGPKTDVMGPVPFPSTTERKPSP